MEDRHVKLLNERVYMVYRPVSTRGEAWLLPSTFPWSDLPYLPALWLLQGVSNT